MSGPRLIPTAEDRNRVIDELAVQLVGADRWGSTLATVVVKSTAMAILRREGTDDEIAGWIDGWRALIPQYPAISHSVAMMDALDRLARTGDGAALFDVDGALRPLLTPYIERFLADGGKFPDPKQRRR